MTDSRISSEDLENPWITDGKASAKIHCGINCGLKSIPDRFMIYLGFESSQLKP